MLCTRNWLKYWELKGTRETKTLHSGGVDGQLTNNQNDNFGEWWWVYKKLSSNITQCPEGGITPDCVVQEGLSEEMIFEEKPGKW